MKSLLPSSHGRQSFWTSCHTPKPDSLSRKQSLPSGTEGGLEAWVWRRPRNPEKGCECPPGLPLTLREGVFDYCEFFFSQSQRKSHFQDSLFSCLAQSISFPTHTPAQKESSMPRSFKWRAFHRHRGAGPNVLSIPHVKQSWVQGGPHGHASRSHGLLLSDRP